MFVRTVSGCPEFVAGDATLLRELLHPAKASVEVHYSLAHGRLLPTCRSKRHRLVTSEVYYFLGGRGIFWVAGKTVPVHAGTLLAVPPGAEQWVENTGTEDLEFLCLVDPAWRAEDEEVLE